MRITSSSPERLEIVDHPWFLWFVLTVISLPMIYAAVTAWSDGFLLRLFVGGLGFGALWLMHHFAPIQRFTFDRTSGLLTHEVQRVTGSRYWESQIADIERAVSEGQGGNDDGLQRVTLLTKTGRYPMESGYTARPSDPIVEAINAWLINLHGPTAP